MSFLRRETSLICALLLLGPSFEVLGASSASVWNDAKRVMGDKSALRSAMRNPQGLLANIPSDTDPELAERESLYANGAGKLFYARAHRGGALSHAYRPNVPCGTDD